MTSRDFVYWLQGLYELSKPTELNAEQTELIRRHLQLVFRHDIDPTNAGGDPVKAAAFQATHDGFKPFFANWPLETSHNLKHYMVSC